MPRGQKNKRHNHQKHQRARGEAEGRRIFEGSSRGDEEPPSSIPSLLEANTYSSSATEADSTTQGSESDPTTTINSSASFYTRSENSQDEEHVCSCEDLYPVDSWSDRLTMEVDMLEKFILYKYRVKQPILEEDMLNIVNKNYHDKFAEILRKASENIEVLFAVDLKEVDSTKHSYDLVSQLKLPNNGRVRPGKGFPKTSLLMSILAIIFLSGNRANEEDIWEFLTIMRVFPGRKHFIYGEPRKLITKDLVKLNYLEYCQVPDTDPPRYEFLWGAKAYAETSKMKVLEFFAKLNDKDPTAYSPQYEEAMREEEEKSEARGAARPGTSKKLGNIPWPHPPTS